MEEQVLSKLIEFVEMASPQVWAMAQRQVYVVALQNAIWGILCLIGAVVLVKLAINRWEEHKGDRYDMNDAAAVFSAAGAGILVIGVVVACNNLIATLVNPQYQAIRMILDLVK